ncbi:MAG: type VI secretion system protein TssA [Methylococcaceae bacterium]
MTDTYLEAIKKPITEQDNTATESEGFIFLEEEMTKFSSMREMTLDWKKAEKTAVELLSEQTKNLRILAHLLLCLQHDRDAERFILSIQLLGGFISSFWESAKPKVQPLKKEMLIKKKLLKQMLIRTEQATSKLDLTEGDRALLPNFNQALKELEKAVSVTGLEYEDFWKYTAGFEKGLPAEVYVQKKAPQQALQSKPLNTPNSAVASEQLATDSITPVTSTSIVNPIDLPELKLNPDNERETKQTFFKMASFLNTAFEKEALGYRLRRFALWFSINSMPPLKKDGNTEIMAVLIDREDEYREALANRCDLELLKNIEQTVSTSPFWITGSYLSSQAAESLGMDDVSNAIQEETVRFVKRLPALAETNFSDGTPFVDQKTQSWLTQSGNSTGGESDEWQVKLQDALQQAKQGRFKSGLNIIEKGINASKQPRDRFYWRMAHADFLEKTGMKSLANAAFSSLNAEIGGFDVNAWEPLLIDEIQGKANTKSKSLKSMTEKMKGFKS